MSTNSSIHTLSEAEAGLDIPVELHLLDNVNTLLTARIRKVSPALFELSCAERLQEGQRLAISHEGRRVDAQVSSVAKSKENVYLLSVEPVADELGEVRSELRLPTDLSAKVRVSGAAEEFDARVVDMSPSGMGIELGVELNRGAKVCVNLEQGLAFGEIRFCRSKGLGTYFAGFLLEEYIGQEESGKQSVGSKTQS